jgi:hypothetical protein
LLKTPEDRWIVPYHPETLLFWDAHMNVQYVTSRGLAKYLTKYVVKPEPTQTFNISYGDRYREHVIARRLGSMECMFLLLGETICNSSIQVKYLPTECQICDHVQLNLSPSLTIRMIIPLGQ